MATKITNKLISLPQDVSIDRVMDHPHSMEIFISCPDSDRLCPVCGSRDCVIKDSGRSLTVRHVSVAGKGSFLVLLQNLVILLHFPVFHQLS